MEDFKNKNQFNKHFSNFINRKWIYCPEKQPGEIIEFVKKHQEVIVKPYNMSEGIGIYKIAYNGINDYNSFAIKAINERLLLEENIKQCNELSRINSSSVNTIRTLCVRDKKNNVHIVSASMRVGRIGSIVDNVSSGGNVYPIDIKHGYICGLGFNSSGNRFLIHPDTDCIMLGFKIPRWGEVVEIATQAMEVLPKMRLVAWDIAITNNGGVELIEGNTRPTPRSSQTDMVGRKKLLKSMC